ncbi:MAG: presenilin family intramembrane aspartyl protease PSH [Betaproteobacteria bacterium]
MKLNSRLLIGPIGLAIFMLVVQVIALLLVSPLKQYQMSAFENPESLWNPLIYVVLIVVYAAVVLLIIKFKLRWLLKLIISLAVFSTLVYVLFGIGAMLFQSAAVEYLAGGAFTVAVVLTALMLVFPEWYVVDLVGILTAAGAAALFGISLAVLPTILLLVALIAYDYIAVYKTKHMLKLAEGVTDMNLPIIFVLPMKLNYSYIRSKVPIKELKEGERETFIMGLGDAVMPTILAVSANAFVVAPTIGFVNIPALGTVVGTMISHAVLMYYVLKGKPLAGLPFLCTGAIIGFAIGCLVAGVNPLF